MWFRNWLERTNDTLLDLIFGCIAFSLLMEIMGLLLAADRIGFTIGLALGTLIAVLNCFNMYRGIYDCLGMESSKARVSMAVRSTLRWIVMLVVAWCGMVVPWISFAGVILGLFSLKAAAHFHVYTHVYITNKIKRKGR